VPGIFLVPFGHRVIISEFNSFDFVERNLILGSIVEFCSPWRLVSRNLLRMLQSATIL
jgi:hypothetical protein